MTLRIASVLTGLYIGGDENRLLHQLRHTDAAQLDHQVVVARHIEGEAELGPIAQRYADAGIRVHGLGMHLGTGRARVVRKGVGFLQAVARLTRFIKTQGIDVLDARLGRGTLLAVAASRLTGTPVVATNYGIFPWARRGRWPLGQFAFGGADTLVCDSRTRLDEMLDWTLRTPNGAHIPNGVPRPEAQRSRADLLAELGWVDDGGPIIGQIARLVDYKGQDVFIDAMPRILGAVPGARFVICGYHQGRCAYHAGLVRRVAELGLTEQVRIISYPGAIGDLWQLIDIQCHPTRLDSSPISLFEAMAWSRPSVISAIGGIPEVVVDGVTGRLLPEGSASRIVADTVIELASDSARRHTMGQAAQALWAETYQPQKMAADMADVYRQAYARSA